MRIARPFLSLTLLALGCGASPERVVAVEQSVTRSEQGLERADESYDLSERDIARIRVAVNEIVERGRIAARHFAMAARDYEYATVHYHLASAEFGRAARNYEIAAAEYEKIASFLIMAASSKNLLRGLCGRSVNEKGFDALLNSYGVNLDEKSIEQFARRIFGQQDGGFGMPRGKPLDVPLPVLKALAKRAVQMLLCSK